MLVQEFTISELKNKVQMEDELRKVEKELEEKERIFTDKEQQFRYSAIFIFRFRTDSQRNEEQIIQLTDSNKKLVSNYAKKNEELEKSRIENSALLKRNHEMNQIIEQLTNKLSKSEDKYLQMEEELNIKYHSVIKQMSELEQNSGSSTETQK